MRINHINRFSLAFELFESMKIERFFLSNKSVAIAKSIAILEFLHSFNYQTYLSKIQVKFRGITCDMLLVTDATFPRKNQLNFNPLLFTFQFNMQSQSQSQSIQKSS